jgi:alpha-L-rhamnosidase
MQFGDWLDPDAPADQPWLAKADSTFIANAFFAESLRLTAASLSLGGDVATAERYGAVRRSLIEATWAKWSHHAITNQTSAAMALQFGLVPPAARRGVEDVLATMVLEGGGRVATGFLGTPLVLPALAAAGRFDAAYAMLLRRECPSWLYQVDAGATTVWERWDAILPDGSIHSGAMSTPPDMEQDEARESHMLSFNHYAYGAVVDWIYRHVAGLAPDLEKPGYRHVILAPNPAVGIDWARASIESPFGPIRTEWRVGAEGLVVDLELPFGVSGTFVGPVGDRSQTTVDGSNTSDVVDVGPGRHRVVVTSPQVVAGSLDPERAGV